MDGPLMSTINPGADEDNGSVHIETTVNDELFNDFARLCNLKGTNRSKLLRSVIKFKTRGVMGSFRKTNRQRSLYEALAGYAALLGLSIPELVFVLLTENMFGESHALQHGITPESVQLEDVRKFFGEVFRNASEELRKEQGTA